MFMSSKIVLLFIIIHGTFEFNYTSTNPSIYMSSALCVQDLHSTPIGAYFQNRITFNTYYTENGFTILLKNAFPLTSYQKMECYRNTHVLLLTQLNQFYEYYSSNETILNFTPQESIKDFTYLQISQNHYKLIYIGLSTLYIKSSLISGNLPSASYNLTHSLSKIKCSKSRNKSMDGYCFISSLDKTKILYFHYATPQNIKQKEIGNIETFQLSQINEKIFIGLTSGQIRQYEFQNGQLYYTKRTLISNGLQIYTLNVNQFRNQLLYYNNASELSIISLNTGFKTIQTSISVSYRNSSTKIVNFSPIHFAIFKSGNTLIVMNRQTLAVSNTVQPHLPKFQSVCENISFYFNQLNGQCEKCKIGCNKCDQQTGGCYSCQTGYYIQLESCISCKYAKTLPSQQYSLCYPSQQILMMKISEFISPYLTSTINYTYSILSGSALLFLFLRFINFWSLVSVYYFLQIDHLPYFLTELLRGIFEILYGSVFQFFMLDMSIVNFGIKEVKTNEKIQNSSVSTDFLKANFQGFIIFINSIILICLAYNAVKKMFKKIGIHLLEKVKLQACLEQFIGIVIPLMVPLYYFLETIVYVNFIDKFNISLFLLFLGIGIVFPFIYTILIVKRITLQDRLIQINQMLKSETGFGLDKETTKNIVKRENKKKNQRPFWQLNFLSQQEGQKCLYCLQSFWLAFLVSFTQVKFFLIIILLLNIMSVWNAFYAKKWKINAILQKSIMLSYHCCYLIIYFFPSTSFYMSVFACFLIFGGGIHEMISAIAQKIYFIFIVYKQKTKIKSNKISDMFHFTNLSRKSILLTKEIKINRQSNQKNVLSKIQESKENFTSTLKDVMIETLTRNCQKKVKKVKILQENPIIIKAIRKSSSQGDITIFKKQDDTTEQIDLSKSQKQQKQVSLKKFKQIKNSTTQQSKNTNSQKSSVQKHFQILQKSVLSFTINDISEEFNSIQIKSNKSVISKAKLPMAQRVKSLLKVKAQKMNSSAKTTLQSRNQ